MWTSITHFLIANPIICIFIALSIGYYIGKFNIKSFSLGSTVGVLIVGLLLGQMGKFTIDPLLKAVFFDLFIFIVGYEVGPAFIQSLKKSGIKLVIQSIFFGAVALVIAIPLFKFLNIKAGEAGGIIAGALTQSATIGTASSAISSLSISAAEKSTMVSQVAIAYAVTYVFGTIGVVIFLKNIAPKILGIDLKEETKKVVEDLHFIEGNQDQSSINSRLGIRAFKILTNEEQLTAKKFEAKYKKQVLIEQLINQQGKIPVNLDTLLQVGDIITVIGDTPDLDKMIADSQSLVEVFEEKYTHIALKKVDVMLTKIFSYHELQQMASNGIVIVNANRMGNPITDLTKLRPGDKLTITGPENMINRQIPNIGYAVAKGPNTDVSFLSLGMIAGLLLGSIVLTIKGIPLTLGAGGGALFGGLYFGWYQSQHENIGHIPESTCWFLKSVGLNLFIAAVGLEAGSQFVTALKSMGVQILIVGAVISILPHLITLLFGRYVLKLNAVDNIGSLAGAGTINAALNAVNEETGSSVFALSFTPAYAIGNILLTIMGPLVVAIIGG